MKRITARTLAILYTLCTALLIHCLSENASAWTGVTTDKNTYIQGEQIRVRYSGAPGYNRDWICIVPSGAPDTEVGKYQSIPNGARKGILVFDPPALGHYEVRAYFNYNRNGYVVSSRNEFSVVKASHHPDHESSITDPKLKQAQYALMERGYDPGEADGFYGRRTIAALREFQKENQLRQSGKLNRETLIALGLLKVKD
jgi:hypothetical protein